MSCIKHIGGESDRCPRSGLSDLVKQMEGMIYAGLTTGTVSIINF
ncbi:hypothetical protein [Eubacterium ventriosum]|nr:hypothetical protein [Eubacterium ventriosum]